MFKKIFIILLATFIFAQYLGVSHGAGTESSSDSDNYLDQYKAAKQFISRAEKLEKKDKVEKAVGMGSLPYPKIFNYIMKKFIGDKDGIKRSN